MTTALFTPAVLGKLSLKNRIVMAPMTRCRAIGNVPNELMEEYYRQRAGAGLIITEGTSPSPSGLGYARIQAASVSPSAPEPESWMLPCGTIRVGIAINFTPKPASVARPSRQ